MDFGTPELVGCMPLGTVCGEALSHFGPPTGDSCWGFSDTCGPDGWTSGCPSAEMQTWEECP